MHYAISCSPPSTPKPTAPVVPLPPLPPAVCYITPTSTPLAQFTTTARRKTCLLPCVSHPAASSASCAPAPVKHPWHPHSNAAVCAQHPLPPRCARNAIASASRNASVVSNGAGLLCIVPARWSSASHMTGSSLLQVCVNPAVESRAGRG